jgi:hypothetical protein
MDKVLMLTDYYVYRLVNQKTGEFYIGSHACKGTAYSCTDTKCNYKGSSSVIKRSKNQEDWVKQIVEYADNRPELAEKEKALITRYIGKPNCLNKLVASPRRRPIHTDDSIKAIQEAVRRTHTKMSMDGQKEAVWIAREDIPTMIKQGAVFSNPVTWIKNKEKRLHGQFSSKTVCVCWERLEAFGWEFGHDRSFDHINASQLLDNIKMKKVRKVVVTYEPC